MTHVITIMTPTMALLALCVHLFLKAFVIVCIAWTLRDIGRFIGAMNSMSSQLTAMALVGMGFAMLVVSHWYGIDTTIAGGVIGAGTGLLKNTDVRPENKDTIVSVPIHPAEAGQNQKGTA